MPGVTAHIPFNRPYVTGREADYIRQAIENHHLSGDGPFTRRCHEWLEQRIGCRRALLTHSCTAALEMAALLADVGPGDEVVMPSYTFVSTANAFALRGARPVFVDIRRDTLNIDEKLLEQAVTPATKAIVVVHYAGVSCEMEPILELAARRGLLVIEDAAQALMSTCADRPLGSLGQLAAVSFHETKNVIAGEGGALLINDERLVTRAEIIWEKGTNRKQFFRGHVDKYTWEDLGSSFLPSEIIAAFLWAQMEEASSMTSRRLALWARYHAAFEPLEREGRVRRPRVPPGCEHNAHLYYLLMPSLEQRTALIRDLKARDINAVFHYVPLHSSPAGKRFGRASGTMAVTDSVSERLVRLPMWIGLEEYQDRVCDAVAQSVRSLASPKTPSGTDH
jgi:dTDP-4-amino-4,6-dideoxygalactose transaminase